MVDPDSVDLQLPPGTILGKYQVVRHLGSGGMGAVYEALHREIGKSVAVKTLNPVIGAHPAARTRFLREAQLTSRMRHPHIVDITDVGHEGGHAFLVMELLTGEDLSSRLIRQGPFQLEALIDIMVPICAGVDTAHAAGVVHRDLKPQNIFLTQGPAGIHPKVLDFGISKNRDLSASALTATGSIVGTPYYLPPELVKDGRAATAASDQYALGVILYECLTGRLPFDGPTIFSIFQSVVTASPTPLEQLRPDLPPAISAIVARAMSPDAAHRYGSVRELAQALIPFASPWTRFQWENMLAQAPAASPFGTPPPQFQPLPGQTPFPGSPAAAFIATTPLPPAPPFSSSPSAPTQIAGTPGAGPAPGQGGTPAGRARETAALPAEGIAGLSRPPEQRPVRAATPRPRGASAETAWQDVSLKPARSPLPWIAGALLLVAAGGGAYFYFSGNPEVAPTHTTVVSPSHEPATNAAANRPSELEVKRTRFRLSAEPSEATIEIDGRVLGRGQVEAELALGRDEHVLRVSAPGYDEKALTFVREIPASPIVLSQSAIKLPDPSSSRGAQVEHTDHSAKGQKRPGKSKDGKNDGNPVKAGGKVGGKAGGRAGGDDGDSVPIIE